MAEMMPQAQNPAAAGMSEGVPPGAEQQGGGDAAQQLRDLVGGLQNGFGLLRTIMESTPGAPEEAKALLSDSQDSFMQAMRLMVQGGSDEEAAQPEVPMAAEQQLTDKPRFVPKGQQTL